MVPIITAHTDLSLHNVLITFELAKKEQVTLGKLQAHLEYTSTAKSLFNGMFHLIVDSGCSLTCTLHKDDFVHMVTLTEPQILQGVGGNIEVT